MTTEAQTEANRANAQKSTGPRTPEGKAAVAQNALKHGLLAKDAVVVGEDFDEFDLFRDQFRADLAPVGMTESLLVERIVGLSWRLQRAERFHTEAFDVLYTQCAIDPQSKRWHPAPGPDAADPVVGLTVVKDFSQTKVLERLLMYERRIENSLYRTMAELRQVQGQRQGAAGVPLGDRPSRRSRREQDRGGPFHRVPETLPPDFTLDNLLAKIAALEDKPASGTTNTPAAEGQSCETKPVCTGPRDDPALGTAGGEEVGRGRPTHEEPPGDGTTNLPEAQRRLCETNPICEEVSSVACQVSSESCETKPICGGLGERQSLCGTGVRSDPAPSGLGETKPISAGVNQGRTGYRPIFRRRR